MAFCLRCGASSDGADPCPACGAPQNGAVRSRMSVRSGQPYSSDANVPATDWDGVGSERYMALLSYLGLLALLPYLLARRSPFAYTHAVCGVNLLLLEAAYLLASTVLDALFMRIHWRIGLIVSALLSLGGLFFLFLSACGILNVCRGKCKPLPFIGALRLIR